MQKPGKLTATLLLAAALLLGSSAKPLPPRKAPAANNKPANTRFQPSVLALTATAAWKHLSIRAAGALLNRHAKNRGWKLTISSNPDRHFNTTASLNRFDVVVFLLTSGSIFTPIQKRSFEAYVRQGGAVAGVHSAVDTHHEWPFFITLFGAEFANHPRVQLAQMTTVDRTHPTTAFLPKKWKLEDEFYNFAKPLKLKDKNILVTVDEGSYKGGTHGPVHPISWTRSHKPVGSRVWFTALGHPAKSYSSNEGPHRRFQRHLALGIEWAANGTASARRRAKKLG